MVEFENPHYQNVSAIVIRYNSNEIQRPFFDVFLKDIPSTSLETKKYEVFSSLYLLFLINFVTISITIISYLYKWQKYSVRIYFLFLLS